jgi:hypothetical protein
MLQPCRQPHSQGRCPLLRHPLIIILIALLTISSVAEEYTDVREAYSIELALNENQVVINFASTDDIDELARWVVESHKLNGGTGCETESCVADVLAAMMREKIYAGQGREPKGLSKVSTIYSRSFGQNMEDQATENQERMEWRSKHGFDRSEEIDGRRGSSRVEQSTGNAVLLGNGHFAAVPCVPPFCSFECAAPPLDEEHLDSLVSPLGALGNENSGHESGAAPRCRQLSSFSVGDDILGATGWPPAARACPDTFLDNSSETGNSRRLHPIRPIWIAIPEERVVACVPRKGVAFANLVRNVTERGWDFTASIEDEHLYHRSYRRSYFGTTRKKSGWDALRHVEILAAGSVPWFTNFDGANDGDGATLPPPLVLAQLPVCLLAAYQRKLTRSRAVRPPASHGSSDAHSGTIDFAAFDKGEYLQVASALLGHTRRRLTTRALAKYVLDSSGHGYLHRGGSNGRVLMLCGHSKADYVRDTLLHGLRRLLGRRFVDFVRPKHLYKEPEFSVENTTSSSPPGELASRSQIYGNGFSFALHLVDSFYDALDDDSDSATITSTKPEANGRFAFETRGEFINRHEETLRQQIAAGPGEEFDLVIFGSIFRGRPLWDAVLSGGFAPDHVIIVDGEDEDGNWPGPLHSAFRQFGHLYMREIPEGCPPPLSSFQQPGCSDASCEALQYTQKQVEALLDEKIGR